MSADVGSSLTGEGLVIVSGPSGVGKSSICKAVLERMPDSVWSVSATTRPQRPGDEAGESYEFIDEGEFERRRVAGEFLESATYCGHRYGTPRAPVETAIAQGRIVVMEIDVQGAIQAVEQMPKSTRIFVLPPTAESLRARLAGRNSERAEQLQERLAKADGEIASARDSGIYRHFVVNDDLQATIEQVLDIIETETAET